MTRPQIQIPLDPFDKFLEAVGFLALALLIGLPMYYYDQLPETIPQHYGSDGIPDGFGNKGVIWTLPLIGTFLFIGMRWITGKPHWFNYTQKITSENAEYQYRNATRLIRVMNATITVAFAYICSSTIMTALGRQGGLGIYFGLVFILLLFGILAYFMIRAGRK